MTQVPAMQIPQYTISKPTYNAVKIDIHNPQVNVPNFDEQSKYAPVTNPMYEYPQAPVYDMPKQSIYDPKQVQVAQPQPVIEAPIVPPPAVIQAPVIQGPVVQAPAAAPIEKVAAVQAPIQKINEQEKKPEAKDSTDAAPAPAKTVDVKAPEEIKPRVDVNEFIAKLTSPDYEQQASAMEAIAEITLSTPDKTSDLLDVRVFDSLLGIMNNDTSKLEGPSAEQLKIRENIMAGKTVSEAEMAEANKITPMELAERNKQYSVYTVAMLQKAYVSEIEKMNNTVVPLTELPGAAAIVDQVKNNPNPMVRVAAIDALSYIERPEYAKDLTTLFTVAKNDQDANVQQVATKALEKLEKANAAQTQKATA